MVGIICSLVAIATGLLLIEHPEDKNVSIYELDEKQSFYESLLENQSNSSS